jgi:ornithine cyclodeaminase/alanine dehydrogenase-like protein (mu-crystallin family)
MSLLLREYEVDELLMVPEAIEAVEEAFSLLGGRDAVNCPRRRGATGDAVLNVMWALAPTLGAMGVKAYPIVRTDVTQGSSFTFFMYTLPDVGVDAIIEAGVLGQRRTGAASAVATKYLANRDSETLTVFGAIVAGSAPGRRGADEITVFESQGLALEDLACAIKVLRRARDLGVGMELPV